MKNMWNMRKTKNAKITKKCDVELTKELTQNTQMKNNEKYVRKQAQIQA